MLLVSCAGAGGQQRRVVAAGQAAEQRPEGSSPALASPAPNAPAQQGPRSLLEFLEIGRGERIADLGAGAGYSIEPMADAVGPTGVVYSRHDPRLLVAAARPGATAQREGTLPKSIVVMETSDAVPFNASAKDLDLVTVLFSYEIVTRGRDRVAFHRRVFEALAPNRFYIIAEHAPLVGAGVEDAPLGRAAERLVRADVEAAGFSFVEAATLLTSTAQGGAPGATPPSQYILKFRRP